MEPENKKQIQIGWWKFVGVQAAVVVILSLVFFSASFYPKKLKRDMVKINNENLTYVYNNYIKPSKDLKTQMNELSNVMLKIQNNQFGPTEEQDLIVKSASVEKRFQENKSGLDSILMLYQRCLNNYALEYKAVKSSGTCPQDLKNANKDLNELQEKFNKLDGKHAKCVKICENCPD